MDEDQVEPGSGITRREVLRRGAILGGAVAWATPVVQVVGMRPALAQAPSPGCQTTTCSEVTDNQGNVIAILRCEPSDANAAACFCCCAGVTSFCPDCTSPTIDPCDGIDINCDVLPPNTPCP